MTPAGMTVRHDVSVGLNLWQRPVLVIHSLGKKPIVANPQPMRPKTCKADRRLAIVPMVSTP